MDPPFPSVSQGGASVIATSASMTNIQERADDTMTAQAAPPFEREIYYTVAPALGLALSGGIMCAISLAVAREIAHGIRMAMLQQLELADWLPLP
jgi:hypothetical protein